MLRLIFILTCFWISCTNKNIEFTNVLDNCGIVGESEVTKAYRIGAATLKLPADWRARVTEATAYKSIEAADTVEFSKSLKVFTFAMQESQSDKTALLDYFTSEVALMEVDTLKLGIIEKGTRSIDGKNSYYVIASDTIQGVVLHHLLYYAKSRDKFYTIQIGSTDMQNPIMEFCKHLWLVDSIRFQ
jgi:hypothetical protein